MSKVFTAGEGDRLDAFMEGVNAHKVAGAEFPQMTLDDLFTGADNEGLRNSIRKDGVGMFQRPDGRNQYIGVDVDEGGHVLAVAAAIPRNPGRAEDFLQQVSDFATDSTTSRKDLLALYNRIYASEGLVNNAVNKCASLVATSGSFKVRRVAGKPGKSGDSRAQELSLLLQFWAENVNADGESGVITGAQGIQDFILQGVRQALIEGDHVARQNWVKAKVPQLGGKAYSLPMNLESFGGAEIEIPEETAGTSIELIYWIPPSKLLDVIKGSGKDKNLKPLVDKLIPKDVQAELKKNGKYMLDPQLTMHIKHRGVQNQPYGESFVSATMASVAYKRSLFALELVTIENLVNRMLVFKIGSDNPDSKYHALEVAQKRVVMLQNLLRRVGPSATIVWAGPDLEIEDAGAHGQVMAIDDRLNLVHGMIRQDLGVPSALLTGEGNDGKSSGIAATSGVAAQLLEIQNRYVRAMCTMGKRIAFENGFGDVDIIWEFSQNILSSKADTVAVFQKGYAEGSVSTRTLIIDGYNLDYEAEEGRQLEDVQKGYKDDPFGPPKAIMTVQMAGSMATGGGRPPAEPGQTDPRAGKETGKSVENK
jgi:hypothetical protein